MSSTTTTVLNGLANGLQGWVISLVDALEVIISDHGAKRPRRSRRTITKPVRRYHARTPRLPRASLRPYYQRPQIVIVNHYH